MADDSYRGYGNDPFGRGGTDSSRPPTDPLTELARLIGQSDPFAVDNRRADPRQAERPAPAADWRNDPPQPAPSHDGSGYHDRYAAPAEQAPYADNGYGAAESRDDRGYASDPRYADDPRYANDPGYNNGGYGDDRGYDGGGQQAYRQGPSDPPYQPPAQPYRGEPDGSRGHPAYDPAAANAPPGYGAPPLFGTDAHAARPADYYDDAPAPRRRGWLVTAAALVGLAVIGTAGAFAYRAVFKGGPPPLITRDVRPDRMLPAQAANADAGDKQNARLASTAGNEQMAPPPEQPINIATAPPAPAPVAPTLAAAPNPPASPPVAAPAAPGNAAAPRKIRTVKITTDQETSDAAAARPMAPRTAQARAVAPPPAHNADAPLSLAPQGVPDAPAPATTRNAAPGAPMRTTALAPSAPAADTGGGGGYYVQVSAQKSQEEARSSFRSMQAKYASLLGGHNAVFRRKDLGAKGVFFGAQVGPFSHERAIHLCESLKSAGGSCLIQRN
jgi:sporulation related protein